MKQNGKDRNLTLIVLTAREGPTSSRKETTRVEDLRLPPSEVCNPETVKQNGKLVLGHKIQMILQSSWSLCQESYQSRIPHPPGPVRSKEDHWNALHLDFMKEMGKKFQGRKHIDQDLLIPWSHQSNTASNRGNLYLEINLSRQLLNLGARRSTSSVPSATQVLKQLHGQDPLPWIQMLPSEEMCLTNIHAQNVYGSRQGWNVKFCPGQNPIYLSCHSKASGSSLIIDVHHCNVHPNLDWLVQ